MTLQMETTKTIDVYINKVLALTNQMKTNGETHLEQGGEDFEIFNSHI